MVCLNISPPHSISPLILLTENLPLASHLTLGVTLTREALNAIFNWYLPRAIFYYHFYFDNF